jgi:hypothetical protein
MSIDFSFALGIGFTVDPEELSEALRKANTKVVPEKFHMEDRFDPKTGAKLAPVKVVDEDETVSWFVGKEEFEYEDEFLEEFFNRKGMTYSDNSGMSEASVAYVTVPVKHTGEDDFDDGNITCGSSIAYSVATSKSTQNCLKKIKKFLQSLGLEVGEPKIFVESRVS